MRLSLWLRHDGMVKPVDGRPPAARGVTNTITSVTVSIAGVLAASWGWRLWVMRGAVARHALYWSQPRGQAGGLRYVALGDSTAQGIGASHPGRGYVGLLAERLRERTGRPVQVVNLSVSGAQITDVVRVQLPRLTASKLAPDLVTVSVGGNDVRRYDSSQYRRDVAALVAGLPVGPTVLADIPYFLHGQFERHADAAARLLRDQARAHSLVVAELHEAQRARGWRGLVTHYAADWFHPNDGGYRVWAQAFWSALVASPDLATHLGLAREGHAKGEWPRGFWGRYPLTRKG